MDGNRSRIGQLRTLVTMLGHDGIDINVDGVMASMDEAEWEFVVREFWGCISITGLTIPQLCEWYVMAEVTGLGFIMNDIVDYFMMFGVALTKDWPVGLLMKLVERLSQRDQLLRTMSVNPNPIGVLQSQNGYRQDFVRICMTPRYKKSRRNL